MKYLGILIIFYYAFGVEAEPLHAAVFSANGAGSVFGGDIPGSNFFFNWCSAPSCQP